MFEATVGCWPSAAVQLRAGLVGNRGNGADLGMTISLFNGVGIAARA
jgi:hypothetical protein